MAAVDQVAEEEAAAVLVAERVTPADSVGRDDCVTTAVAAGESLVCAVELGLLEGTDVCV